VPLLELPSILDDQPQVTRPLAALIVGAVRDVVEPDVHGDPLARELSQAKTGPAGVAR
jgi:hypothetical protein